jgi:hypothetical protein
MGSPRRKFSGSKPLVMTETRSGGHQAYLRRKSSRVASVVTTTELARVKISLSQRSSRAWRALLPGYHCLRRTPSVHGSRMSAIHGTPSFLASAAARTFTELGGEVEKIASGARAWRRQAAHAAAPAQTIWISGWQRPDEVADRAELPVPGGARLPPVRPTVAVVASRLGSRSALPLPLCPRRAVLHHPAIEDSIAPRTVASGRPRRRPTSRSRPWPHRRVRVGDGVHDWSPALAGQVATNFVTRAR